LSQQDNTHVQKAYKKYTKYFHNAVIQENIRNSKEEQFQEGFLRELFVDILGYTLNPAPSFNLTTELKNIKGAKKVDGAILKDGNALGVIELKGTNTKDLESIRQQAFDYKANQTGCVYVITSNFEKLRFYINNAVDYEEFNLFTLTHAEFEIFYLCLAKENILANKPLSIKEASVVEEENITKKFYYDYSVFKRELYRDLVKQNRSNILLNDLPEKTTKLILFQKSQKLIDRFLFILFAEDRGLLAPNSINTVLKEWKALADLDVEVPLYDRYKQYFGYLDTGRKGTDKKEEIFAYNGGLFQPDAILDAIIIDNELLYRHTLKLSTYDFESQVDVNILGHIFEHSLNEIESVNAEIEGTDFDKQKTKRKKDGVFYTPKYITKYIVDNTIGKLCTEKKQELGIIDEEYAKGRKNRQTNTIIKLDQQLKDYREWLLELTICDPACGSGAFLNQALDFLIKEHAYLDELNKQLFGGFFIFPDIENQILEHNIYGVDLNEESIEIAKLSLWLRTAQPKRKLTSLNNNIKCGNSLIESKAIAGDKAFNWKEEFPEVFAKGGFDVIIGNPPYAGRSSSVDSEEKMYIKKNYSTSEGKFELYQLFIEKCFKLVKSENSFISFITPQTWLSIIQATKLRKLVLKNNELYEVVFLGKDVFEDASVDSLVFIINTGKKFKVINFLNSNILLNNNSFFNEIEYSTIDENTFIIPLTNNNDHNSLIEKIKKDTTDLEKIGIWSDGVKIVGPAKDFAIQYNKVDDSFFPILVGKDIEKFSLNWSGLYCCRDKSKIESHNATDIRLRENSMFIRAKILIRKTGNEIVATIDTNNFYNEQSLFSYGVSDSNYNLEVILAILNSKLANFLLKENAFSKKETFPQIRLHWLKEFPIPKVIRSKNEFIKLISNVLQNKTDINKFKNKFSDYFSGQYKLEKLPKKLENWSELLFANFIAELNKAIKTAGHTPLTKKDEYEWLDLFEENKTKAQTLKSQIDTIDKAIDKMVYELYGLSEEEIGIVENS
jgi:type I restriction-modification system DNA methylase subunit